MASSFFGACRARLCAAGLALFMGAWPGLAPASVMLNFGSAEVEVDAAGTYYWTNQFPDAYSNNFFSHSWWYRIGSAGAEAQVSSLLLVDTVLLGPAAVRFEFRDPAGSFRLATQYGLSEADGKSILRESIIFNNFTAQPLDLHLFMLSQQTNLDINLSIESPSDYDGAAWVNPDTVRQVSPRGSTVSSTVEGGGSPARYQMDFGTYNVFTGTYYSPIGGLLRDAAATNLAWPTSDSHSLSPFIRSNLEWAWQWDLAVDAQGTAFVDVANRLSVPEPASLGIVALALALVAWSRRATTAPRQRG